MLPCVKYGTEIEVAPVSEYAEDSSAVRDAEGEHVHSSKRSVSLPRGIHRARSDPGRELQFRVKQPSPEVALLIHISLGCIFILVQWPFALSCQWHGQVSPEVTVSLEARY